MKETYLELVKRTAAECGVTLSDAQAEYVLWNETGFPGFLGSPELLTLQKQVKEFCTTRPNEEGK
jgi:hypothetical protein